MAILVLKIIEKGVEGAWVKFFSANYPKWGNKRHNATERKRKGVKRAKSRNRVEGWDQLKSSNFHGCEGRGEKISKKKQIQGMGDRDDRLSGK